MTPALAQLGELARRSRPSSAREDRGGVLADPGDAGLGAFGHLRELHRVAGDEDVGSSTPSVRGISTSMWRAATCGSAITSGARLLGPATMPAAVSSSRRLELRARRRPRLDRGPDHGLEVRRPARAGREARVVLPLGMTDEVGEPLELVLARRSARRRSRPTRGSPRRSPRVPCSGSGRTPSDQKFVTTSVIATIASSIAMSTYWPTPVRSRWRSAARTPITPNSAGADVAQRADRDRDGRPIGTALVVVDARHRLDDRRVRGPVAIRRLDRVAEPGDRQVDRARDAAPAITS